LTITEFVHPSPVHLLPCSLELMNQLNW